MVLAAAQDGYPLLDLFWTMLILTILAVWVWLLVLILGDLLGRDSSGAMKALWVVGLVVLPYVGVLAYLLTQGRGMVERRREEEDASRSRFERGFRALTSNGHPAGQAVEQVAAAKQLLDTGAITRDEFEALKRKVIGSTEPSGAAP
jgi:NADH:ubiquinone oxidoreductase subunit 3 (subunit A)